jgi:hypothetical protein
LAIYLALLGVEVIGALALIWKELSSFNQLLENSGEQIPFIPYDDLTSIGIVLVMRSCSLVASASSSAGHYSRWFSSGISRRSMAMPMYF